MLDKITVKPLGAIRILLVGDVVGLPGLNMCTKWFKKIQQACAVDGIVVNGENSAKDGRGITEATLRTLLAAGANMVSTGNHVWRHQEFYAVLNSSPSVVRPANFPAGAPGHGFAVFQIGRVKVAVLNLLGRVFLKEHTSCPFTTAQELLPQIKALADIILVDFHAETTSEKSALGLFLDGQVAAVFGTHTHVQTADQRVLPLGTAFMTDLGCVASLNSCLGVQKEIVIEMLRTQLPARFKVAVEPPFVLSGAIVDINPATGLAINIAALRIVDDFLN